MAKKKELVEMEAGHVVLAHRHPNGGGWVAETAKAQPSVLVEANAKVYGKAVLTGNCKITGEARISGRATISREAHIADQAVVDDCAKITDKAKVADRAKVTERAIIGGDACVYGDATIHGDATIRGNARINGEATVGDMSDIRGNCYVGGKATLLFTKDSLAIVTNQEILGGKWFNPPLFIQMPYHPIMISRPGYLKIGCEEHGYEYWVKNYRKIGNQNCYSQEMIKRYHFMIKVLVRSINKGAIPDGRLKGLPRARYHVPTV